MEHTEPMDVDDSSPQGAKEDPNVCNATNRKFLENVQCFTTTLKTKDAETVLKPINGVLNSGGGIVEIKIDGFSNLTPEDLNKHLDIFWSALQPKLNLMVQPSAYADIFDQKREEDTIHLFIRATEHFCTVDYNLYLPGDAGLLLPPKQKVVDLLSERDSFKKTDSPQVPLTDLISLVPEQFMYKEVLNFHESKQVQLKYYTSKNELFDKNNRKAQDEIKKHISSFGNGIGGVILIGIKNSGEVRGQGEKTGSKKKLESEFNEMVKEMSKTWSFTPTQGIHWDVKFVPVTGAEEPRSVIAILIAGMQNLGGIFTKCPKSFELQDGSGSGGAETVVLLNFSQWKQRMLKDRCKGESKGTREAMEKFRLVELLDGPLLTVQGSVEEIVKAFFPVGPKCQVVPNGFKSNLPKEAKQVIQKIQKQITNGLLVASSSILSAVQKERQRKEDGVICDLLLLSESLGRLHLISLVSSGSQDQFFPHAHATAKAVKKSLVRNGGCYEKFYITCQVVLCNRVGTEPLEIPSPDSRYPKEYDLRSSAQELVKINKILQSLVIVLAQFPSFLSNKQGSKFLNLLTKEQFELLSKLYNVKEKRELWIQGVAGTGKTVVALEFIRRLLNVDRNLKPENILYVCERPAMLPQISKRDICKCCTRKTFMEGTFPQIRHVILDEVQNFQAQDGDWLRKARALVRQHITEREFSHYDFASDTESFSESESEAEQDNSDTNFVAEHYPECSNDDHVSDNESVLEFSRESETEQYNSDTNCVAGLDPEWNICQSDGPGYLWCFIDKCQGIYKSETGIPKPLPHTFNLNKVIRNSKLIFNHAKKFLDGRIWPYQESARSRRLEQLIPDDPSMRLVVEGIRKENSVTIGHDFAGEQDEVEYSKGERITRLIEVLKSLLEEGYRKGHIAILCFTKPLERDELERLQEYTSTVNAEGNYDDDIVLSTVEEYSGLERLVVIIVGEPLKSSREMWPKRLNYCAATRAKAKLITLKKKSRGQKRKKSS